ncbi:MAG TPA: MBL fold metallo-hydrolase [Candidatus Tectomicrobia bacterium]|jgi:glyoxylase-like metal-dependent hydrolase (beta-lactamase superfamily II)
MPESRFSVGNVQIVGLTDIEVELPIPLSQLFPNVPAVAWAPHRQRYPEVFPRPDTWRPHFGGFLLRSQGRTILVDTGMGSTSTNPGAVAMFTGGTDGRLLEELHAVGVRPEEVDTVFFTHLHPDHVGWNLSRGGGQTRATFPRARYVTHQADWEAFKTPQVQASFPFSFWEETLGPLETLGVLDLLASEQALTSEITAIPTPGHTPGSMSLVIVSGGQRALIIGDVTTNPAQVTEPDWIFAFDMDPTRAVQTRRHMLERAEAEDALLIACHFPHPGHGRLIRLEGRRYWQGGL